MADHMTQMQALFEVKLQESAAVAAASAAVNGTVDSAADNMPRPTTPRRSPGSASLSRSTTSLSGHQRSLQNVPPISSAAESVELVFSFFVVVVVDDYPRLCKIWADCHKTILPYIFL